MTATPGPWHRSRRYVHHICGPDGAIIAKMDGYSTEADAILIAAVPDLLEAAYRALDGLDAAGACEHCEDDDHGEEREAYRVLRAAIAKAVTP